MFSGVYGVFSQQLVLSDLLAELSQQIHSLDAVKFALVYCTNHYATPELLAQLSLLLNSVPSLGMQVPGLLVEEQVLTQGVLLILWCDPGLQIAISSAESKELTDLQAGQHAASNALRHFSDTQILTKTVCMLCHPGLADCSQLLQGAVLEVGSGPEWIGGGCEVNAEAGLMINYQWTQSSVVLALICSSSSFATQLIQGLMPLGASALVSQSEGAVVKTLNYQTALDTYREMARQDGFLLDLNDFEGFASHHPLGLPLASGHYLIRTPYSFDAEGRLVFLGSVATHSVWQLMSCHQETLIQAGKDAAIQLQKLEPSTVLAWVNQSRLQALGRRAIDSLTAISHHLQSARLLGCISQGEIASLEGGVPQFHNHSIALLGISCATKP